MKNSSRIFQQELIVMDAAITGAKAGFFPFAPAVTTAKMHTWNPF
jgi:hypothetical protein